MGNVEFLARSEDTPRFNLVLITMQPHQDGPSRTPTPARTMRSTFSRARTFAVEGEEITAGPGTFVLVPPGVSHTFANRGAAIARVVNVHAPAGFDLRLEGD